MEEVIVRYNEREEFLLIKNALEEAGSDGFKGMMAVTIVVLNRVKSDRYPGTIEEVILQEKQFSWTLDKDKMGKGEHDYREGDWREAGMAVVSAFKEVEEPSIRNYVAQATHYARKDWVNAGKVSWASDESMVAVAVVGSHIFFKEDK